MYPNHDKKTRRRPIMGAISLAAITMAALTACSPFGSGGGDDATTLEVWTAYAGSEKETLQRAATEFEASHEGWDVKISVIPEDVWVTKFQTAELAKDVPDIALVYTSGYVGSFQSLDDTLFSRIDIADYNAPALEGAAGYDGHLYGVGSYVDGLTLAYNKELFAAAGIPFPATDTAMTLSEYTELARELQAAGATYGGVANPPTWWQDPALYLDETGRTVDLTSPEFVAAFSEMTSMITDGVAPSQSQLDATGSDEAAKFLFLDGQLAMTLWEGSITEGVPDGFDFGLAPIPVADGRDLWVARWSNPYGVPVAATHPDEAVDFLELLATTEQPAEIDRGNLPIRLADGDVFAAQSERHAQFRDIMNQARVSVFTPNAGAWLGTVDDAFSSVLLGGQTAEAALADAQPKAQQLLDTSWKQFDSRLPKD